MLKSIGKIYRFAGKNKNLIVRAILFGTVESIFHAMQLGALLIVLQAVSDHSFTSFTVFAPLAIMLVSVVGKAVFGYLSQLARNRSGYLSCADKRIELGNRIRYMPMGYFNENSLGNITARLTTTLFDYENMAPLAIDKVVSGLIHAVMLTVWITVCDWRIGLLTFLGILIFAAVNRWLQSRSMKSGPLRQKAQSDLAEAALEYLQGMGVVKAFGLSAGAGKKFTAAVEASRRENTNLEKAFVFPIALQQMILRTFSVLIILYSILLYLGGTLALPLCLTFIVASFFLYGQLESAGSLSAVLRNIDYSIDKIQEIEGIPLMDTDGRNIRPENRDVSCEGVSFSYEEKQILRNINLTIPENTTTAIVGPSGSGKTTLCHLISRFWDVDAGSIQIGGSDVREYNLDALLRNISMVFQNVYLFHDTILNNIRFGKPNAGMEEVVKAAKMAQCHDFISALPDGYDTVIGESGATVSGGEKQRISIARALLKDAPIIILDEATANVDPENEEKLQKAVEALTKNKTIIMIAHRLKTVRHADQILVLDEGQIVQRGRHDELLREQGIYRSFVERRSQTVGWKVSGGSGHSGE